MKSLGDMNAAEIAAAYNMAIRNLRPEDIQNIEKNPLPTKEDTPLIAYAKTVYRLDAKINHGVEWSADGAVMHQV